MLKSYLKIAFRNLFKNKVYSFINIFGLAVGIVCCILIYLHVSDELTYDAHHQNSNELYRVSKTRLAGGNEFNSAWSQVPMGPAIEANFPSVKTAIRFWRAFEPVVGYEDDFYKENGLYFADPEVFEVFSFSLLNGVPGNVLDQPRSAVLTRSAVEKYFGDENPVGKVLSYQGYPAGELELTVTGVMEDLPFNSQFRFDMLVSMAGLETEQDNWGSHKPIWSYLWLEEGTEPVTLEATLPEFLDSQHESSSETEKVELEPLTSVHLYSSYDGGFKPGGSITYIYLFSAIGFFLLLIACINFTNLSTARAIKRAGEVGVRKTLGANRVELIKQFMGEAFFISGVALFLAVFLAELSLPILNNLADKQLTMNFWGNPEWLLALTFLWGCIGFFSGLYPALLQSRYKPIQILGNKMEKKASGEILRKSLVVFQFSVSVVLIAATLTIYNQMEYIRDKNLGFDKEQVVVLPYSPAEEVLLNRLEAQSSVVSTSVSQRVPVNTISSDGRTVTLPSVAEPIRVESYVIDEKFLDTYKINLTAGRNISENLASDSSAFLINETAVREFGWQSPEDALGKTLTWNGDKPGQVIGVVEDFHMTSLHERIAPLVMHTLRESIWWRTFISVRIAPGEAASTLSFLEQNWKELTPEGAYNYFFVDQSLEELHRFDLRMGKILGYFSILAIFIACLGLFGLATFAVECRTKEIGIRKVMGATIANIVALLSKDFIILVIIGFVIAIPIAWYSMNQWLADFAYRIEIGPGIFAIAGGVALAIALLTVSWQSIKAAVANPVESLRSE